MAWRQLEAACFSSSGVSETRTSFFASAKVTPETSGPAAGAVPKAGGMPGGGGPPLAEAGAAGCCSDSGVAWQPTAAAARPMELCLRKARRDLIGSLKDIALGL